MVLIIILMTRHNEQERREDTRLLFTLQGLYRLLSYAHDKSNGNPSYCVTKLKSIMIYNGALPVSLLPFYSYYSVSIFSKVGVDGFIGSLVLFVCMFTAHIIGLLAIYKVSIFPLFFPLKFTWCFLLPSLVVSQFSSLVSWE